MAEPSRWRMLRLHLTLLVLLPTFILLANWQLHRALGGNELSWAYTVEWPLFAVYAIFVWWRLLHEERGLLPKRLRSSPRNAERRAAKSAAEERDRDAYNAYLEALRLEEEQRTESKQRRG